MPGSRVGFLAAAVCVALLASTAACTAGGSPSAGTTDPVTGSSTTPGAGPTAALPDAGEIGPAVDPSTWSNALLAGQLTFACVPPDQLAGLGPAVSSGLGGVGLLGGDIPAGFRSIVATLTAAADGPVRPVIASDEEGGQVQRLDTVLGPVPSAKTMGTWETERVRRTAADYGTGMRSLGVTMDFGPVADLAVPGSFIDGQQRAFAADPATVIKYVGAWRDGMSSAGVATVVKHWPGHGHADDSHTGPAAVPPYAELRSADLLPFVDFFRSGADAVMVGHLTSAGLTEPGVPASQSQSALRVLREQAGPDTVIITDSLSMAAASTALDISPEEAAVRAIVAGADWALVCSRPPAAIIKAIKAALDSGRLTRPKAVASVGRIMALKRQLGLIESV